MADAPIETTLAAHWAHFAAVDIVADAPQIQRREMERAFMAGISSGVMLSMTAFVQDDAAMLDRLLAEFTTWCMLRRAEYLRPPGAPK